jgi:Cu2+-exporting ATPase
MLASVDTTVNPETVAQTRVACAHCGLLVPLGLIEEGAERQFCCRACAAAFEIIHGCGLERYYALRERTAKDKEKAAGTGESYARFDDPAFHELHVRSVGEGMSSAELRLEGVHCAACVWLIEALPRIDDGVVSATLDLRQAIVRVVWDDARVRLSRIGALLDSMGYRPAPARGLSLREHRRAEDRRYMVLLAVAGACAGNVMLISGSLYAGAFQGMSETVTHFFRAICAVVGLVALFWPGSVFIRGAIASLRVRRLHLDLPIAIGLLAGGVWGTVNAIRGTGEIYFDSVTGVIFLLLIGRWLQHRQQRRDSDAVELLYTITPTSARLVDGDATRSVPIEQIAIGEVVEVHAGESVPVDGVVVSGASSVEQSMLTGEPIARPVSDGAAVSAGALNLDAAIRVRVEATGEQTRVGRLMRLVEESATRKAPIIHMADRISGRFVAAALSLAFITLVVWLFIDSARALDNAIALLIVTCPCALGLATPLAVSAAIGKAGRIGILVKGGDALERLARPGLVFLDKTGTVTEGRCVVAKYEGDETAQPLVGALERHSSHPLARAITQAFSAGVLHEATDVKQTAGAGIEGRVGGKRVCVGSRLYVLGRTNASPNWAADAERRFAADALTPIHVSVNGKVVAVIGVGDPIRADAQNSIDRLRARGWRVALLSGDHPDVVKRVGERLGVDSSDCTGDATPEEKLHAVEEAMQHGPVVMVGDGVNDAAALAAASVGVAVRGGAEASLEAADVSLSRQGVAPVADAIEGSERAMRVIRRNLRVSLAYNVVCASCAMVGLIHPLLAAVLMPLSSITVITLSYRSRTFEAS